jgi:hypothetical protein
MLKNTEGRRNLTCPPKTGPDVKLVFEVETL